MENELVSFSEREPPARTDLTGLDFYLERNPILDLSGQVTDLSRYNEIGLASLAQSPSTNLTYLEK